MVHAVADCTLLWSPGRQGYAHIVEGERPNHRGGLHPLKDQVELLTPGGGQTTAARLLQPLCILSTKFSIFMAAPGGLSTGAHEAAPGAEALLLGRSLQTRHSAIAP